MISQKKQKLIDELKKLKALEKSTSKPDTENIHYEADILLLKFINNKEVTEAFMNLNRWYS